jgi:hypothetical protein
MSFIRDLRRGAAQQGAPVTIGLIVALAFLSIAFFVTRSQLIPYLQFDSGWMARPWSVVTYPFAFDPLRPGLALIFFLIMLLWLFWVGTSTERDLGSRRYAAFLVLATVIGAAAIWLGMILGGARIAVGGPELPLAALTVVWGMRNKSAAVRLWGIIPMTGALIAALMFLFTIVNFGSIWLPLGLLACIPLLFALAFANNRIPGLAYSRPVERAAAPSREQRVREERYFEEVRRREQERAERERLRKLFEGSLKDDEEDKR